METVYPTPFCFVTTTILIIVVVFGIARIKRYVNSEDNPPRREAPVIDTAIRVRTRNGLNKVQFHYLNKDTDWKSKAEVEEALRVATVAGDAKWAAVLQKSLGYFRKED